MKGIGAYFNFSSMSQLDTVPRHIIRKSNKLINSRAGLTTLQSKIFHLALSYFNRKSEGERDKLKFFNIPIRLLLNLPEEEKIPGGQYTYVKKAAEELTSTRIYLEKPDGSWGSIPLMIAEGNINEGTIRVKFVEEVKAHITSIIPKEVGGYTEYFYEQTRKFENRYSFRVYELAMQYFPKRTQRSMSLKEFRSLLQIEKNYKRITDLRKYLLDVAVKEISETSNIRISYKLKRKGRRFETIVLDFEANPNWKGQEVGTSVFQEVVDQETVVEIEHEVVGGNPLPSPGVPVDKSRLPNEFLSRLGKEYGKEYVAFVYEKLQRQGGIKTLKGAVVKHLKFKTYFTEFQKIEQAEVPKEVVLEGFSSELLAYQKKRSKFYKKFIDQLYQRIDEDERSAIVFDFEESKEERKGQFAQEIENEQASLRAKAIAILEYLRDYDEDNKFLQEKERDYDLKPLKMADSTDSDQAFLLGLGQQVTEEILILAKEQLKKQKVKNEKAWLISGLVQKGYLIGEYAALEAQQQIKKKKQGQKVANRQQELNDKLQEERITQEFDGYLSDLRAKYLAKQQAEDALAFYEAFKDDDNAMSRRFANAIKEGQDDSMATNFFASWLVKKYGREEEKETLEFKDYARRKHNFIQKMT